MDLSYIKNIKISLSCTRKHKLGLDVAVFTMPFHGARRGKGSLFSGHMLFAGGFSWINEAFRQLVFDFRALDRYLREVQGAPQVGVSGVSLGGYTSGLLAGLQQDLAFAIPNVPLVSIPDLVLEWNPVASAAKLGMRLSGRSLATLRRRTALHSPLSHDPLLPVERLMIIGGVGDRLAPPKHARLLWEHWSRPRIHWFPGNHLMHLDQGDYLRQIAGFLSDIEFLPASARRV